MTAIADAAYAAVTALLYGFAAVKIARRPTNAASRLALGMFATWWCGMAVLLAIGAALSTMDWANVNDPAVELVLTSMSLLSTLAAVWGLVFYVTYVYTGKSAIFVPSLIYYALIYAIMLYAIVSDPTGAEATAWHRSVVRLAILTGPVFSAAIIAMLLPAIIALVAYARLYPRLESRAQKFRVALTTTSLVTWLGLGILAYLVGIAATSAWVVTGRFLALAAAIGVLVAHAPPTWLSHRLKLNGEARG